MELLAAPMTDGDHQPELDRLSIALLNALILILGIATDAAVGYLIGFVGIIAIGIAGLYSAVYVVRAVG